VSPVVLVGSGLQLGRSGPTVALVHAAASLSCVVERRVSGGLVGDVSHSFLRLVLSGMGLPFKSGVGGRSHVGTEHAELLVVVPPFHGSCQGYRRSRLGSRLPLDSSLGLAQLRLGEKVGLRIFINILSGVHTGLVDVALLAVLPHLDQLPTAVVPIDP
jgi:hypothetical protein